MLDGDVMALAECSAQPRQSTKRLREERRVVELHALSSRFPNPCPPPWPTHRAPAPTLLLLVRGKWELAARQTAGQASSRPGWPCTLTSRISDGHLVPSLLHTRPRRSSQSLTPAARWSVGLLLFAGSPPFFGTGALSSICSANFHCSIPARGPCRLPCALRCSPPSSTGPLLALACTQKRLAPPFWPPPTD